MYLMLQIQEVFRYSNYGFKKNIKQSMYLLIMLVLRIRS